MDVLRDVKRAEEDAERVEQDYRSRADQLLSSVTEKLDVRGIELDKQLDSELEQRNGELNQRFESEREAIVASGRKEREAVEAKARSRHDEAVDRIFNRLLR